jgi:two-component system, response regulator
MNEKMVNILLVEDNPSDIELSLHAFKKVNLANEIEVVDDGAEALDFIYRKGIYADRLNIQPKLILLDLKLPKIDGLEVLRKLKSDPQTRTIPIVVLTTSRQECDVLESYKLGENSYIVKPVNFEQVTKVMNDLGFYWLLLNQPPVI